MDITQFLDMQPKADEQRFSPLALAYLGDAVFELCIRALIVADGNAPAHTLHDRAKQQVCAERQAKMYVKLYDILTEEERTVIKRGRNAKSHTKAKNASITDYRHATGIEALFGYLFMQGENERMMELLRIGLEGTKDEQ